MKKTLFTLAVDGYAPEIRAITFPLMQRYAEKIGAEFHVITERKFPDYPPVYEKLQIHELGRDMGNDWNLYVDADALIHPALLDPTDYLTKDTVFHNGCDPAAIRFTPDQYFKRDARNIGSCNWFTIASDWCLDLWRRPEEPLEDLVSNISLIQSEVASGVMGPEHLIDDYILSRNIARFGLKVETMPGLLRRLRVHADGQYLWHIYTLPLEQKAAEMLKVLEAWKVLDLTKPDLTFSTLKG